MDKLSAFGHKGTISLVDRGYKDLSWSDTDFYLDLKVGRGVCLLTWKSIYSYFALSASIRCKET